MKHRGCEAGLKHRGWVCAFWLVLFGRSFRGSFFGFVLLVVLFVVRSSGFVLSVVLFVVRAFGRSFWSFFSWFVLLFVLSVVLFVVRALVVLFVVRSSVRAFGRSFCGSFFWGLVCVFCSML